MPLNAETVGSDAVRFGIAGLVNTGLSLLTYQLALFAMSPSLAYGLSWVVGLAFLVLVYPDRVFVGGRRTARDRALLAASYLVVFILGLVFLRAVIAFTGAERLAILAAIGFTTVLNFISARFILRRAG